MKTETHTRPTQASVILSLLSQGIPLTPLDALKTIGCFRLGARIWELRKMGHDIKKRMVKTSEGKRIAEYSL